MFHHTLILKIMDIQATARTKWVQPPARTRAVALFLGFATLHPPWLARPLDPLKIPVQT